ncbi:conserved hypothetical protein [Pediculus humanus corporis]|uniref:Uncharacterized protein n=1 Tax=Pediculus humanus subsp. corporis TaxID=121224 RepID=E0VZH3_PEDHC|nr:uncharacterized protein Phum_PHUM534030 [Pediculus humanus corporis]EEB18779.1 conserved hypothetical protein [Pediculus humanus corporis]
MFFMSCLEVFSESSFLKNIGKTINHDLQKEPSFSLNSNGFFYIKDYNKKYSKSLNDLNSGYLLYDNESIANGSEVFKICKKSKSSIDSVSFTNDTANKFAKTCIANLIFLNAWRRQKNNYKQTQEKVNCLNEKLDGFEMQVYLLRQLLNAEKSRVDAANENIQNLIQKLQQHDLLEKNYNDLMEYNSQLEFEIKNQENEILTEKFKSRDFEKQLEKERDELNKILIEQNILKEQLKEKEQIVNDKTETINELNKLNEELQLKLSFHVSLVDKTTGQVKSLNDNELDIIQEKIIELTKNKYFWNGGIIKVASLCAKIPVACICTVGSLLLPFPSYRI